jgi:hypothetical protein
MINELIIKLKFLRFKIVVLFLVLAFNFFFFYSTFISLICFLIIVKLLNNKLTTFLKKIYITGFSEFSLLFFKKIKPILLFFNKKTNLLSKLELIKSSSFSLTFLYFTYFFFLFYEVPTLGLEFTLDFGETLNLENTFYILLNKLCNYIITFFIFFHIFFGLQSLYIDYIFLPKRKSLSFKDYTKR